MGDHLATSGDYGLTQGQQANCWTAGALPRRGECARLHHGTALRVVHYMQRDTRSNIYEDTHSCRYTFGVSAPTV